MSIYTYIRNHAVIVGSITFVVIAGFIIGGRVASRKTPENTGETAIKTVTLVPAASFKNGLTKVTTDGTVESVSQVDIKSQISAPLSSVNVVIGQNVSVGQTLAQFQNAGISAQLAQARSALALAEGQFSTGAVSVESARKAAINAVHDAYQKADEGIHNDINPMLVTNVNSSYTIYSFTTDAKVFNTLTNDFIPLSSIMADWKKNIDALTASSSDQAIHDNIDLAQKNIAHISNLLNNISGVLNDAQRINSGDSLDTINAWQVLVATLRTTMSTQTASLTTAESTLTNATVSHSGAGNAQVEAARAGVANLEAEFAKTIITSPINGKIAALPLRTGELATPGQLIATVVGNGGLQVKVFISAEDVTKIKIGAKTLIENTLPGRVINISPSIDDATKKVEVKVAVDAPNTSLIIGKNVSVSIDVDSPTSSVSTSYILPIQNIKITPGSASVFTIDQNSLLVKHDVVLGKVEGNSVEVVRGLNDSMNIVTPVYELEAGQKVTVK